MANFAEVVVEQLVKDGADHFFLIVGGNAMYIDEAIRQTKIPYTIFHHEQAAAMAADAYAKVTGKMAVCVSTSGPGASNLLTGISGAYTDSSPVFFLAGQAKKTEMVREEMRPGVRQFGTFELPIAQLFEPVTKASISLRSGDDPAKTVRKLSALAMSGRPGPVFLEIPIDVQGEKFSLLESSDPNPETASDRNDKDLHLFCEDFLHNFSTSKRPLILAGHGIVVAGVSNLLGELSELLKIPVITTQLAKDLFSFDDPNFVGHAGLRGDRAGNLALYESDLLLCIGTSLQQQTVGYDPEKFAENTKKFVVDFERSISNKNLPIGMERLLDAEVADVLTCLLKMAKESKVLNSSNNEWNQLNQKRKAALSVRNEPHDLTTSEINMYDLIYCLSQASAEGDIVVTDAGLSWYVMGQAYLMKKKQRFISSGGLGAMGYAIPAAIGASLTKRGRTICVTGDGSAQFNIQELATIVKNNCQVIIFIVNNGGYASIRNTQKAFFSLDFIGTTPDSGLSFPNWEKLADAYGIKYQKIADKAGLIDGIDRALISDGPLFVEVICQEGQVIMPAVSSHRDSTGALIADPLHEMSPSLTGKEYIVHLN